LLLGKNIVALVCPVVTITTIDCYFIVRVKIDRIVIFVPSVTIEITKVLFYSESYA